MVSDSDVESYKQIKSDLDVLRQSVEKSELWVYKSKASEEHGNKKKKNKEDEDDGATPRKAPPQLSTTDKKGFVNNFFYIKYYINKLKNQRQNFSNTNIIYNYRICNRFRYWSTITCRSSGGIQKNTTNSNSNEQIMYPNDRWSNKTTKT